MLEWQLNEWQTMCQSCSVLETFLVGEKALQILSSVQFSEFVAMT